MPASKKLKSYPDTFYRIAKLLQQTEKNEITLTVRAGDSANMRRQWYGFMNAMELEGGSENFAILSKANTFSVRQESNRIVFVRRGNETMMDEINALAKEEGLSLQLETDVMLDEFLPESTGDIPRILPGKSSLPSDDTLLAGIKTGLKPT